MLIKMSSFLTKISSTFVFNQLRNSFRLSGIYPAVVTPFTTSKEIRIDYDRFQRLLTHLKRYPLAGYAMLASFGEPASIGYEKKLNLIASARKYLGHTPVILAGAGLESTADTVELVNKMAEAGADACFVFNPTYFREQFDDDAYLGHFRMIADKSAVPIILYNIPSHLDKEIPLNVVVELAKHRNIVGLLDTSGDISRIATICKRTSQLGKPFDVMAGSACFFLPGLTVGCRGAICAMANILPFELHHLQELFEEGKYDEAQQLQWRLMEPNEAITPKYGVAGLKAVLRKFADIDTGSVCPPLRNLTEEETLDCIKTFHRNGFLLSKKQAHLEDDWHH